MVLWGCGCGCGGVGCDAGAVMPGAVALWFCDVVLLRGGDAVVLWDAVML
jgi:hypothetical protein